MRQIYVLIAAMTAAILSACTSPAAQSDQPAPSKPLPGVTLSLEEVQALPTPRTGRSEVVAHRGGVPENSLEAFRTALATPGVGALELDVQTTKDGVLIVMHDHAVDRTTNGTGMVMDLTAAEIAQLRTPRNGAEPPPTLAEVLALVKASPDRDLFIEIKTPAPDNVVDSVLRTVTEAGMEGQSIIISFSRDVVDEVRSKRPDIRTGYVSQSVDEKVLTFAGEYLFMRGSALNLETMPRLRETGKLIYAWTVNNTTDMKILLGLNVDGLITDKPAEAVQVRDETQPNR